MVPRPVSQVSRYDIPDLSIADAADALNINPKTVRRAIAEGRLPAYRVGKLIRLRRADLAAMATPIPTAGRS